MSDNLQSKIARLHQEERQSAKTNRPYYVLTIEFKNGYKLETFLTNEQNMLVKLAGEHQVTNPLD